MSNDKILKIEGRSGACWESNGPFNFTGTLKQAKEKFYNTINTGIQIRDRGTSPELVTSEFFNRVGKYIFNNLEQEDVLKITGTLESMNRHLQNTGNIKITSLDRMFYMYDVLESQNFKYAKDKSDRSKLFIDVYSGLDNISAETIQKTTFHQLGSRYILDDYLLSNYGKTSFGGEFKYEEGFNSRYPGFETEIKRAWREEVCEKSIFPFLEEYYSKN